MKKIVLTTVIFCFTFSLVRAQDDMYFTPKKNDKVEVEQGQQILRYRPIRDVDEYNRRGQFASSYFNLSSDSLYSDVIDLDNDSTFIAGDDSIIVDENVDYSYNPEDDYVYTRRMCRYDDFYWYDPWWYGWYRPYWYGGPYWYAGWWYDPWYDPWYYGWYNPWWHYPTYWYGSYYRPYRGGITGTMNHGRLYGHNTGNTNNFKGYRGTTGNRNNNRGFNNSNRYNNSNYSNRFSGNRQNNDSWQNMQSRPSYNNSFGGNRSGGSFRGGGSFGGSRGGSGGGGFRGRR